MDDVFYDDPNVGPDLARLERIREVSGQSAAVDDE